MGAKPSSRSFRNGAAVIILDLNLSEPIYRIVEIKRSVRRCRNALSRIVSLHHLPYRR